MDNITTVALSRIVAQDRALDVTAGNIANAATPGFRAERMLFTAWLAQEPRGGPIAYAQDQATFRDPAPGTRRITGNPLDIAIGDAEGWFTVQTPRGPRLTRAGQFRLDAGGAVVDALGDQLLDVNGRPLQTAPTDTRLTVAADGTLASEAGPIGRIGVVRPDNADRMTAEGGTLFAATTPTNPIAAPQLLQGAVEDSNVQPIQELTHMMQMMREFQFATQMVEAENTRQTDAIDKIASAIAQG
jgi:flagellar basal-body rod protein FlgF